MKRRALLLACALVACSSSHVAPAEDAAAPDAGAAWQVVFDGTSLDRDLLSAWGTAPDDVYAVGGALGTPGFDALVLHFDGSSWRELPAGGADSFWWVFGSSRNDVWMVGEKGRITHWDGASFVEHPRITTATLFGVWAASPNDAWAVGGTPEGGTASANDVLLHWDGSSWSPAPLPSALGRALFKVWGTTSEDLYAVGEAGTIWHRKGSAWALEGSSPPLAHGTLFTVFGCNANEVYAIGGRDLLRSDGAAWSRVNVTLGNDANGVTCAAPGAVAIVGFGAMKQRLVDGVWTDESGSPPFADLHSVWADPSGALWAAGGDFVALPTPGKARKGVLARYGVGSVSRVIAR